jgi:hypothetical protein
MRKFRKTCIACDRYAREMNKEHFYPKWLINRTRTYLTGIKLERGGKPVNPRRVTLPICVTCNSDFNRELEIPVQRIFADLDEGRGISNNEAELFVRWLWKFEGLHWRAVNPDGRYTPAQTLRQRILKPIDVSRDDVALAVSRIAAIDHGFQDQPMGFDSYNHFNAVFVSGVICRVAFMVLAAPFVNDVPEEIFSVYRIGPRGQAGADTKLLHPKTGFALCTDAVVWMRAHAPMLAYWHDRASEQSKAAQR